MSGHSKWANIKHRKGKLDAQRGASFTKAAREIIVAVKQGGPEPEANFRLRLAIQAAKSINMPNDSISRAVKRAVGDSDADNYEEMVYEGYGPGGSAFIVEATTNNRNRTAADVRFLFSKNGGNLGETGCVGWMFDRKGIVEVPKSEYSGDEESLMEITLDAGAEDIAENDDSFEIYCAPENTDVLRKAVEAANVPMVAVKIGRIPQNMMVVDEEGAVALLKLYDALEEHDDVQSVYSNFEIPDEILEKLN